MEYPGDDAFHLVVCSAVRRVHGLNDTGQGRLGKGDKFVTN
jgi:hypothetical protein